MSVFRFSDEAVERATDALLRRDYRCPQDVGEVLREEFRGTVRAVLAEVVGEVRDTIQRASER